ncbi:MAG: FAD binding domain-containing protein [Pseudomonadota bacterium]
MTEVHTIATLAGAGTPTGQILGGGTILMRELNYAPQNVPSLVRVLDPALREVKRSGDGLLIGAGVTMAQVMREPQLAALAPVARSIGGPALRNMATVGGNLFAPHPYGDFCTALLALDAQVVWADGREEALEAFLAKRDSVQGIVAAVSVPAIRPESFRYRKVSRTKPKGISVLSIAFASEGYGGRTDGARLAFGAMGPTPRRAKAAEAALRGVNLSDRAAVEQVCQAALQDLDPPDDAIASAWYRRKVAPIHLRRLLMGEDGP